MGKKVLIAEDESNILVSLEFLMEQSGYEIRTVADGEEALRVAREFRPDLMLLDVMLPLRNGFEVCQLIREAPDSSAMKIVMLTAKGRDTEVAKGLALGADAYITKPFATRDLLDTVQAPPRITMKRRLAQVWGACFALAFGTSAAMLFMVDSALVPEQQAALREVLSASAGVIVVAAFIVFALTGVLAYGLTRTYSLPARRLTESLRLVAGGNAGHRTVAEGSRELRELATAVNGLAARHEEALRDVQTRVAEARADADQQRNRLGALMSELAQSVIVCNADGRILLYNERARSMFTDPDCRERYALVCRIGTGSVHASRAQPALACDRAASSSPFAR